MTHEFSWQDFALCRGVNPDLFFPEKGDSTAAAKDLCFQCPVQQPCLYYALVNNQRHGVWGGMSEYERRTVRRKMIFVSVEESE